MTTSRELSDLDLMRLFSQLSVRDHALFSVMATTGARINEALTPKWRDFDTSTNPCTLRLTISKQRRTQWHVYPLHLAAQTAMILWLQKCDCTEPDAPIFQNSRCVKYPITARQANRILKFAAINSGLSFIPSTHSIRKYFARKIYNLSHKDIMLVAEALNHCDVKSTMHYLRGTRSQVDKLLLDVTHPLITCTNHAVQPSEPTNISKFPCG